MSKSEVKISPQEISQSYTRVFSSPDGQRVLADLSKKFSHPPIFDTDALIMAGRAAEDGVLRYINIKILKGQNNE